MQKLRLVIWGAAVGLALSLGTAHAQTANTFGDKLGTIPVSNANRAGVSGTGAVTATLSGTTLTIEGSYRGLSSDATGVAVYAGEQGMMGVDQIKTASAVDTIEASGTSGEFSGTVELAPEQLEVLQGNGIFVVVQTSANPEGEIRGWLVAGNAGEDTAIN